MTIESQHDEALERIRAIIGEHFDNWAFVITVDGGDLYYDYNNWRIGEKLLSDALGDLRSQFELGDVTVEFEDEREDGDEWKDG